MGDETACWVQAEFKADYSDLPARSEEELASKIKALQQEYEHGTFTSLAQEKQTMIQIRKLESLTQKVHLAFVKVFDERFDTADRF